MPSWMPGSGSSHADNSVSPKSTTATSAAPGNVFLDGKLVGQHVANTLAMPLGSGMYMGNIDNSVALPMPGLR
jgi:hypothetical protein